MNGKSLHFFLQETKLVDEEILVLSRPFSRSSSSVAQSSCRASSGMSTFGQNIFLR